jgi:acyl carrier protein
MLNGLNNQIREIITAQFPLARAHPALHDDSSLLESGIIDSMGILDLVMVVEEQFSIVLEDDDLIPANFESIANLAAFVQSKRAKEMEQ